MTVKKLAVLTYGTLCYLLFLATFAWTAGFLLGVGVPKDVNTVSGEAPTLAKALAVNGGLLGLFAVQHLVMARHWFKRRITKVIPAAAERSTFVLVTCLILVALFIWWQPLPEVVWQVTSPVLSKVLVATSVAGFLGVVFSTFLIDHFELFGLSQVLRYAGGRQHHSPPFQVRSLYRLSRHPLYLFFLIAFWATPLMTVGHLVFALLCTGFILVGVQFEERGLIAEHGRSYSDYRARVPMILPRPGRVADPVAPTIAGAPVA